MQTPEKSVVLFTANFAAWGYFDFNNQITVKRIKGNVDLFDEIPVNLLRISNIFSQHRFIQL